MTLVKRIGKHKDEEHRPKPEQDPYYAHNHDESNWLVSYADMMTLLCGFFIMLFSMASLDQPKYEAMKAEVAKQFGGRVTAPDSKELAQFVTKVVQEAGVEKNTVVKSDPTSVTVAFQSRLFFDTLSAEVKPEGQAVLDKLITAISRREGQEKKSYKIVVEGHTDAQPILGGNFPSNWELAAARASRVVRMFTDRGFDPGHLTAISYGETRPEVPSRLPNGAWDEAALAKNRRVVLRILDSKVDAIPMAEAPGAAADRAVAAVVGVPAASGAAPAASVAAAPVAAPALPAAVRSAPVQTAPATPVMTAPVPTAAPSSPASSKK